MICIMYFFTSAHSTPKREGRRGRDSFADFQEKTNDAWDDGDDELIVMANFKMSLKDVRSTAIQVGYRQDIVNF